MKQKHYDLIIAWANGEEIERLDDGKWINAGTPSWLVDNRYRIKPEPKPESNPDIVLYAYAEKIKTNHGRITHAWKDFCEFEPKPNIKLTYDDETKELKSVEKI